MDQLYHARLGSDPHRERRDQEHTTHDAEHIHVQTNSANGQPIPIQLPNIYVHPYPQTQQKEAPPRPAPPVSPAQAPPITLNVQTPLVPVAEKKRWGPFKWTMPHPLLWISLIISVIALVLEVPKGSLPTVTGRHKVLRAQEKVVQEKLQLLTKLSTFLPPPLSALIAPFDPLNPISTSLLALPDKDQLELLRMAPHLRFWNTALGRPFGVGVGEDGERWWSVEELPGGASVVRSKGEGQEREIWVIRMNDENQSDTPQTLALSSALTHSLLLRDRLQTEISQLKSTPCPVCPNVPTAQFIGQSSAGSSDRYSDHIDDEAQKAIRREEQEKYEERRKREREREKEVEEREREVARREKWVVEEMRKMSEKIHNQANELTLEDRITKRLKQYHRQIRDQHINANSGA
ncbi:hypothetical protein L204_103899 [Cryptococcus depauperatus]|nr:hypothetical protein L204_03055 [Cryptococcus depauperatus CBS 7855]